MKILDINNNSYTVPVHSFKARRLPSQVFSNTKKIATGLAALTAATFSLNPNNNEKNAAESFDKRVYNLRSFNKANSDYWKEVIDSHLDASNIELFEWIKDNYKTGSANLLEQIHNYPELFDTIVELFNAPDIQNEHISMILAPAEKDIKKKEQCIENYKINCEKIKELTPFVKNLETNLRQQKRRKDIVLSYLNQPPYKQNLSYMTKELVTEFINKDNLSTHIMLDVLYSKDLEEYKFRYGFLKFVGKKANNFLKYKPDIDNYRYDRPYCELFSYINKDNVALIKNLIREDKYYPIAIETIAKHTNKDNIETIRAILNDELVIKDFDDFRFDKILPKINKENAKRVLELFNMAEGLNKNSNLELFLETPQITMDLCKTYGINPLLVIGELYINAENAPVVKKIEDSSEYDYDTKRMLANMSYVCSEAKDLIEALIDEKFKIEDIEDIYVSAFHLEVVFKNQSLKNKINRIGPPPAKDKFQAIMKIVRCKDLTSGQKKELLKYSSRRPVVFLAKHLVDKKTIDTEYINDYWNYITSENIGLVHKLLLNKNFSQKYMKNILQNYKKGSDKDILSIIESGEFEKNIKLIEFPTDSWRFILDNKLKFEDINKKTISYFANANNKDILALHQQLRRDVYSNRNILKPGPADLTEEDLEEFLSDKYTILALDKVGKGVLESAFPESIYGAADFCEDIGNMKLSEDLFEKLMLKIYPQNTKKYKELLIEVDKLKANIRELAGEDLFKQKKLIEQKTSPIIKEIKELKSELSELNDNSERKKLLKQQINSKIKALNELKLEINSLYKQSPNYEQINTLMKEIYKKQSKMKKILANKVNLSPQKIAEKVRVIAQLTSINENEDEVKVESESKDEEYKNMLNILVNLIKSDTEEHETCWNNAVYEIILKYLDIPNLKKDALEKLDLVHSKYLSKMFTSSGKFFDNLQILVEHINNNDSSTEEIIDNLPQNIETKNQFEKFGINYEKWTKIDKNSYTRVKVKLDIAEAKRAAIENLEEDLNDEMFKRIPVETEFMLKQNIKDAGFDFVKSKKVIYDEDGFNIGQKNIDRIYKDGKPIEFEDLGKVINAIKEQINADKFWFEENAVEDAEKAREHLYFHLMKMRIPEFENAKNMKEGEVIDIEVHKVNMYDIKKSLGIGNDAACCTALGSNANEWTAPNYIMDKFIGAIELTDRGNFAGNTMIYLAKVNGKLSLILDNIELKAKYQFNDAIRDAFFEYAHKLCAEIGRPDMPIFAGPNRHKVNLNNYEIKSRNMEIIGDSGNSPVYLDFDASEHNIYNGNNDFEVELYKISP